MFLLAHMMSPPTRAVLFLIILQYVSRYATALDLGAITAGKKQVVEVATFQDVQYNLQKCGSDCTFRFVGPVVKVGPRDTVSIRGTNVTLLGARSGMTRVMCTAEAPDVLLDISRGDNGSMGDNGPLLEPIIPAQPVLGLAYLHFTNCSRPTHIIKAQQATVKLHNVTFSHNQPRGALLHLQLSPGSTAPALVLNGTTFFDNVLPAGGRLLHVVNLALNATWGARDPDLVAAVYDAAVAANISSYSPLFDPDSLMRLLNATLLSRVMRSSWDGWWAIHRKLEPYLQTLMVQVVMKDTVLRNNTGLETDLVRLTGVNVTSDGLQLVANRYQGRPNSLTAPAHYILGVSYGGAVFKGLVANGNVVSGLMHFHHSLGRVSFEDAWFEKNEELLYPMVAVEAGSIIMDDLLMRGRKSGVSTAEADGKLAEKLRHALHIVNVLWFVADDYGQARGDLDTDSYNRMLRAGKITGAQELWDVAETVGLGQWYNSSTTVGGTMTARFMQLLEMATLYRILMFKRSSPVSFTNVTFISNHGSSCILHISGASMTSGTQLSMKQATFVNNTFLSPAHKSATPATSFAMAPNGAIVNGAILFAEYVQAQWHRMVFASNKVSMGVVVSDVAMEMVSIVFEDNESEQGLLVASQNLTGRGSQAFQNYVMIENLVLKGNEGMGPLMWTRNTSVAIDTMAVEGNKANLGLKAKPSAYRFYTGYSKTDAELPPTLYACTACKLYQLKDVTLRYNRAATALIHLNDTVYDTIERMDCQYNAATCLFLNANLNRDVNLDGVTNDIMNVTECVFGNNVAAMTQAAGLAVKNVEWVQIGVLDTVFHNNEIPASLGPMGRGAALSFAPDDYWTSKRAGYLYIENITLTNNRAPHGGAMYLNQTGTTAVEVMFVNNTADGIGGGLFCDQCMFDSMSATLFERNQAQTAGGAMLKTRVIHWVLPSQSKVMVVSNNRFTGNVAWGTGEDPYDPSWEMCPSGAGGGICATYMDDFDWRSFGIMDNTFENNTATWGGAVFLNNNVFGHLGGTCRITMDNNVMLDNRVVNGSGPVLFFNTTKGLCFGCPVAAQALLTNETLDGFEENQDGLMPASSATLPACPSGPAWEGNVRVGPESYGKGDFASYPQELDVSFCDHHAEASTNCSEKMLQLRSGANFKAQVKLLDAYQNVVPRALHNITLVVKEGDGLLVYNFTPVMLNQTNSFLQGISVQALQVPDGSHFPINFIPLSSQGPIPSVERLLEIRSCYMGELVSDRWTCVQCGRGSFSQHPNIRCLPCPLGGNCNASGVMVPRRDFWQSSPYSPVVYRCLLYQSCSPPRGSSGRGHLLRSFLYHKTFPMSQEDVDAFMAAQCNKGYQGRLCGTCQQGYGRVNTRCIRCLANPQGNSIILLLAIGLVCGIVALLVYTHIKGLAQGRQAWATPGEVDPTKEDHAGRIRGLVKVLVSYTQVLAITRSVPLDWPTSFMRLLELVDVTSAPSWVSIDCSSREGSPQSKAIIRVIITALIPAFLSLLAFSLWSIWALIWARRKKKMAWGSLCTLTIIQICYMLYPFSAGAAFSVFGCFRLEPQYQDKGSIQLYKEQGERVGQQFVQEGRFWLQNFEHECYKGSHAGLTYGFGIPWTIVFTIGFPVYSAYQLYRHREDLGTSDVLMKYGFLYEEYTLRFYAWESVIMFRKAALLAVVAFMHHYGGIMQLCTAIIVVIVAALAHDLCQPYREDLLNTMERLSLFSTLLHLATLLLIARQSPIALRWVAFSVVIVVNAGVVVYSVYRVFLEVQLWMEQDGQRFRELFKKLWESVKKLVASRGAQMSLSFARLSLSIKMLPEKFKRYM